MPVHSLFLIKWTCKPFGLYFQDYDDDFEDDEDDDGGDGDKNDTASYNSTEYSSKGKVNVFYKVLFTKCLLISSWIV